MAAMKAQNAGLKSEVSDLKAENQQMKAQIAAMMAKLGLQFVKNPAQVSEGLQTFTPKTAFTHDTQRGETSSSI